jgi:hypothetical protein
MFQMARLDAELPIRKRNLAFRALSAGCWVHDRQGPTFDTAFPLGARPSGSRRTECPTAHATHRMRAPSRYQPPAKWCISRHGFRSGAAEVRALLIEPTWLHGGQVEDADLVRSTRTPLINAARPIGSGAR